MTRTLHLDIPQWQGGNKSAYRFGADLLAFLTSMIVLPCQLARVLVTSRYSG